ncbi:MAG: PIG-L family deacetylase [Chloroflexota bacterium]|nr:PIG-L family deacetylase [Chloroflexota bacterium]MDE2920072.1 PIG-L family deacetylase [Chloroflexota bacterium]
MRVIAISARPGDAEFAVGGTLARHRKRGDDVTIVTVANGNSALDDVPPRELATRRRSEAETAAERLGVDLLWMGHSDFAVQADAVTRVKLVDILRARKPDLLLAPAPLGNVLDASGAWNLARAASEMAAAPNVLCEGDPLPQPPALLAYERDWIAGFTPTDFVDISDTLETKHHALDAHVSLAASLRASHGVELGEAAETVVAYRGLQAGVAFAEAFRSDARLGPLPTRRLLP